MCASRSQRSAFRAREFREDLRELAPAWAGTNFDGSLVMTNRKTIAFALLLLLAEYGCSSNAEFTPMGPFEEPKHVQSWANSASAVGVYSNVFQVLAVADGHGTFADASCPVIDDDGTTWNAHGACTDSEGTKWQGQASVVRDGAERALTLDGFQGNDGTVALHEAELDLHEFDAHLVLGGFTTINYSGSVQGGYSGPTLWNGSGQVTRDGFIAPNGTVDATTLDEKVDNDVCPGQPVSGRTTITMGADEAVISYDGESDCDDAQAAKLSVNGEERGTVDGITCTVTAPAGGKSAGGATSLACCVTAWVLRRRAQRAR
jgi:hypothetical protein